MAAQTFRERFKQKYRKYRAILILTNSLTEEQRVRVDTSVDNLEQYTRHQLREREKELDRDLKVLVRRYGVKGTLKEMEVFIAPYGETRERFRLVTKYELTKLFSRYENRYEHFPMLPPHARIGIDVSGWRTEIDSIEVYQLEAALFEDMAMLWNATVKASTPADQPVPEEESRETASLYRAIEVKRAGALLRATAKAAFNLLEGYLNSIAFDVLLTREVSQEERCYLLEWDEERERSVYLSLRQKILRYTRVATQVEYPPLQETSSEPMRRILELEEKLRHALIHPTPIPRGDHEPKLREAVLVNLSLEEVADTCDTVVQLILDISNIIGPEFGDVTRWLTQRNSNGLFPEEIFY